MELLVGKFYKITFQINEALLTYTCKVISIDDMFISFIDKFNKEYTFNKKLIISFEEVRE